MIKINDKINLCHITMKISNTKIKLVARKTLKSNKVNTKLLLIFHYMPMGQ